MARGGARPGAGRPKDSKEKQTLVKEQALLALRELVLKEITPIAEALITKAKTGDIPAIKELFDRAFGKAPQAITGEDGGALIINFDTAFSATAPSTEGNSQ
jgi:hypothetical protein